MQPEGTQTALEACQHAEARIREVQQLLLDARPETIDHCEVELQQVVGLLERLVTKGTSQMSPPVSSALDGLRRSAQILKLQTEYASNLCLGWIQMRLGTGYTEQGLPVLVAIEPGSSFEV
jgi:hypothetical protein